MKGEQNPLVIQPAVTLQLAVTKPSAYLVFILLSVFSTELTCARGRTIDTRSVTCELKQAKLLLRYRVPNLRINSPVNVSQLSDQSDWSQVSPVLLTVRSEEETFNLPVHSA